MTDTPWTFPTDRLTFGFPGAPGAVVITKDGVAGGNVAINPLSAFSDGVSDAGSTFSSYYSASDPTKYVPPGTYKIGTQWVPSKRTLDWTMSPGASFTGAASPTAVDWSTVIPFQVGPVWTSDIKYRQFDSSFSSYGNIFAHVFQAENIGATKPTVALFAHGIAGTGSAGNVWGANIVASSSVNGSTLFGLEVNLLQGVNSGYTFTSAIGLMIGSAGYSATTAGLVIQSNTAAAQWDKGLWFHNRTGISAAATTYLIFSDANDHAIAAGIDFRNTVFTSIDFGTQSFQVVPPASATAAVNFLQVKGGASASSAITTTATGTDPNVTWNFDTKGTGTHFFKTNAVTQLVIGNTSGPDSLQIQAGTGLAILKSRGSSTDSSPIIRGQGAGGVVLQDGGSTAKLAINTTGIGFFNTTPAAKPTISGSRGSNAALASLLTAMATFGLLTDSST